MERLGASQLGRAALESPRTRPVAYVTFALNYRFGHYDVVGYRAVNLLLHALNGVLVYLLARALLGLSGVTGVRLGLGALFAALLFTAHPLQAVTYIVQRMTILCRLGRPKEARRQYGEALRLEPDYAKAHNNLGVTLIRLGDVAGALHHFAEAVRIDPNYGNARASLMRAREMLRAEAGVRGVK